MTSFEAEMERLPDIDMTIHDQFLKDISAVRAKMAAGLGISLDEAVSYIQECLQEGISVAEMEKAVDTISHGGINRFQESVKKFLRT